MKTPAEFPYEIETRAQAVAIGAALHEVLRFDADWAARVFDGDSKFASGRTGRKVLNEELKEMWGYWTEDERRLVMTGYIAARISR